MRRGAVISLMGIGALAACGAPSGGGGSVAAASKPLTVDGMAFVADIGPGPAGERLTGAGAVPTAGAAIVVRRADGMLADSEGLLAKRAAEAACDAAGGKFNPAALGRYAGAGVWSFNGSCA